MKLSNYRTIKLYNQKGITLIEVLITLVIMGLLYLVIGKISYFAFRTWWTGSSKMDMQEETREVLHHIVTDLNSSRASSVCNLFENTSFETDFSTAPPQGWVSYPAGDVVNRISTPSSDVKSGYFSLRLNELAMGQNYQSNIGTCRNAGTYIFSGWGKVCVSGQQARARLMDSTLVTPYATLIFDTTEWAQKISNCALTNGWQLRIVIDNLTANTSSLFDDISLAPQSAVFFSTATSSSYYGLYPTATNPKSNVTISDGFEFETYTTIEGTRSWRRERIGYVPSEGRVYREYYYGSNWWWLPGLNPIGQNIKSINLVNSEGRYVDISIVAQREVPGAQGGMREHKLDTRVYPMMP